MGRLASACWFTNLDHGKRHQSLQLDTMEHNLKFNKKLKKKFEKDYGKLEYPHYDNYDAIEIPFVEAIPSDYDGVMGVPITFMDKYNPEQFEIVGHPQSGILPDGWKGVTQEFVDLYYGQGNKGQIRAGWINPVYVKDGKAVVPYQRILIRSKKGGNA